MQQLSTMAAILVFGLTACEPELPVSTSPRAGQTKFVLVEDAMWGRYTDGRKRNGALLFSDPKALQEHERLFLGNHRSRKHACTYHYVIQFWRSATEPFDSFLYNKDCEKFEKNDSAIQAKMREHRKLLESNQATHFTYNLKIPIKVEQKIVEEAIAGAKLNFFISFSRKSQVYEDTNTRLSFDYVQELPNRKNDKNAADIEIKANEKRVLDKVNSIVDEIRKISELREDAETKLPTAYFDRDAFREGRIIHSVRLSLQFASGADITEVAKLIESRGGKINSYYNPSYWFIQLVDTSDKLGVIKAKLASYKFWTDVYEYPNKR